MPDETPRPLSATERGVLERLLSADFEGAAELRAEAAAAMVVGRCNCGCPTFYLRPAEDVVVPLALVSSRLAPVEGRFTAADGLPGEAIIFLREGHLDSVEYVYYGGLPPGWPRPSDIAVES